MIHLSLFVGKLPGAVTGSLVNHERWLNFDISRFPRLIKEELYEGALETRSFTHIEGESRTGHLDTGLEIYDIVFFCQFPVRKGILGKVRYHAAGLFHNIILGSQTLRHSGAGKVGDSQ